MQKIVSRHEHGPGGSYLFPQFTKYINKDHVKVIFEAGSRDLLDAIALRNFYKDVKVYAFECNPEGIKTCKHNLNGESNIYFFDTALGDIDGQKTFYSFDSNKTEHHNHGVSSFFKHNNEIDVPQSAITVNCTKIDTFCKEHNIDNVDMLCFDMQGGEYSALRGALDTLRTVKYVFLENDGHSYQNAPEFALIEKLLADLSFIKVERRFGDCLYLHTSIIPELASEIITGNAFKRVADDFLDEEKRVLDLSKKPKIIFLKTDWIELFKSKVLPKIDYSFKLITHNADRSAPSGNTDLLNDPRLIAWYAMNTDIIHPKLQPIPIGIANEKWPHGNKETLLKVIHTPVTKLGLCYSNFSVETNFTTRKKVNDLMQHMSFIDVERQKLPFEEYLLKLKSYKYAISPPGNGVDCHRIWECLYLGVVPIVLKSEVLDYFNDLPILFIDSYRDLTQEFLNREYDSLTKKSKAKYFLTHYRNLILTGLN
jgi:FkbM family methyltransferase